MTVDEQISTALKDVAATIAPRPDPYGRAYARLQRSRRRRRTSAGLVVAALVAGAIVVPRIDSGPVPSEGWNVAVAWTQRMTEGPVRGPLGGDEAFLDGVRQGVLAKMRAGDYSGEGYRPPREYRDAKIVFAGDVHERRVVMVALELSRPDRNAYPDDTLWLSAPAGSDAATVVESAPPSPVEEGLAPLQVGHVLRPTTTNAETDLTVAVVPHGCEIATSTRPQDGDWRVEPTVSYLERTPANLRGEWWRVTCEGTVTLETPSLASRSWPAPSAADLTAWSQHARGRGDLVTAVNYINAHLQYRAEVSADPKLIWAGSLPAANYGDYPEVTGTALVLAAPKVSGDWKVTVSFSAELAPTGEGLGADTFFQIGYDPASPAALIPLQIREGSHAVLVVAPDGAVRVRAVTGAGEVAAGPVADGAVQLTVPDPTATTFEALDAQDEVIAHSGVALGSGIIVDPPTIENWGFPQPFPVYPQ